MNEFNFILSKEKFGEYEAGNTVYTAVEVSEDMYLVKWEVEDGWEGVEYTKADVEDNVVSKWWIKLDN